MQLRTETRVFLPVSHAAQPRILQLLPENACSAATRRALLIAETLRAEGGEMVIAGANDRSAQQIRRAGVDHRPYKSVHSGLFQMSATQALLDTVHQRDLALVSVQGAEGGLSAKALALAANLPLVMTCDQLPQANGFLARRGTRKYFAGRPVIVRSDYAADCLRRDYGVPADAIRTVAPGLDLAEYSEAEVSPDRAVALARAWGIVDDPRPVILIPDAPADSGWLSRLLSVAGHGEAPDALWVLIGKSAEGEAEATRHLARRGVLGRVRWVDGCTDWAAAYKLAALVVSLPTEPQAIIDPLLEAQAMGRSVITSDIGAASEMVLPGKTGWLVRDRDPGSLLYAVSAGLARDEIVWNAMSMAARNHIATAFSAERMRRETLEVYRSVLGAAGGA